MEAFDIAGALNGRATGTLTAADTAYLRQGDRRRQGVLHCPRRWHPPSQLREQRYLTRQELDVVAPDHPVFVQTVGQFAMANTKALALDGITRATQDPVGGKIFRDANGEPTGVLEETTGCARRA